MNGPPKTVKTSLKASKLRPPSLGKFNRASGITVSTKADDSLEPYADEPLADEAWLANYRKIQEEESELDEDLTKRLENRVRVSDW